MIRLRNEASNKKTLWQIIRVNLILALVNLGNLSPTPYGTVVRNVITSSRGSLVAYRMKVMTRTLPVAKYLYTIYPTNTPSHVLYVVKVAANKKVFRIFSVPVLNFTILGQQVTIKSVRFWSVGGGRAPRCGAPPAAWRQGTPAAAKRTPRATASGGGDSAALDRSPSS